ncbi:hypothetical protein HD806DRAFT_492019 [Xylariaceae sp. AK1471]|nr:hypothetical protein HD806DRAFT_492019 [Xylariaceae sp. AK1471]
MASSPRPGHQIRRVPVPVRHSPASISNVALPSLPATTQTESSSSSSSSLPLTRSPIVVRGQDRPRGPIQLVATNSHQPLPAHASHGYEYGHHSQHLHQYSPHTIRMDSELQATHHSTLPAQVEEDIKASVRALMPPTGHTMQMRRRRSVPYKKTLRWISVSLAILLVVGEIVTSIIRSFTTEALYAIIWAPLLSSWNAWRLLRLRYKHDIEKISWFHLGGEFVFLAVTIFLATWATIYTVGLVAVEDPQYYHRYSIWEGFWRGVAVSLIFFIWVVLHGLLLIITIVEKRTKPKYEQVAQLGDAQQFPPIIVQYMPTCQNCHAHIEPQPGENENPYLAGIGDSQPQGVTPAYLPYKKEAMHVGEVMTERS